VRNRNKNVLNLFSNFDFCTRLDVELFFRGYVFFYLIFFVECIYLAGFKCATNRCVPETRVGRAYRKPRVHVCVYVPLQAAVIILPVNSPTLCDDTI